MSSETARTRRVDELFEVKSGDFHATKELDPGPVPLISCGDTRNGLMGYFDIPDELTHQHCITVAYNGSWPLMAKFHPYRFGAKDDVAVLRPLTPMQDTTLFCVIALLNRMIWRYSYGRKCFREKLCAVPLAVPMTASGMIDEAGISELFPVGDLALFVKQARGLFSK